MTVSPAELLESLQRRSFESGSRATRRSYPEPNRLSGAELSERLGSRRYLVLATTRSDERPHAALTSFVLHEGLIWIPLSRGPHDCGTYAPVRMRLWS